MVLDSKKNEREESVGLCVESCMKKEQKCGGEKPETEDQKKSTSIVSTIFFMSHKHDGPLSPPPFHYDKQTSGRHES